MLRKGSSGKRRRRNCFDIRGRRWSVFPGVDFGLFQAREKTICERKREFSFVERLWKWNLSLSFCLKRLHKTFQLCEVPGIFIRWASIKCIHEPIWSIHVAPFTRNNRKLFRGARILPPLLFAPHLNFLGKSRGINGNEIHFRDVCAAAQIHILAMHKKKKERKIN